MHQMFKALALVGDEWVLWLLVCASLLSIAVIYERWRAFQKNDTDVAKLMDEVRRCLERSDLQGAQQACEQSHSVAGRVAAEGIVNFSKGPAALEEVLRARLIQERKVLEKRLIILGTLGNNAPFVGLFGTVLGVIKAFNDLAVTAQSGVSVVMAGVSSALVATAFGILVAIPAVVANNYFVTRLKETLADTESLAGILMAYLKQTDKR
jgi:biopolymer transport protein ExbB